MESRNGTQAAQVQSYNSESDEIDLVYDLEKDCVYTEELTPLVNSGRIKLTVCSYVIIVWKHDNCLLLPVCNTAIILTTVQYLDIALTTVPCSSERTHTQLTQADSV